MSDKDHFAIDFNEGEGGFGFVGIGENLIDPPLIRVYLVLQR